MTKEADGSSSLSVKRKDETGKEIVYFYFDNPKSCAEYQTKRLGDAPPVPYYDYGGCVGECCQYAAWTAKEKVVLRQDHSDLSPVVTTIEANEKVDALTGVVITKQLGKIEVLKEDGLSERMNCDLPLKKGGIIYSLHYLGEMNSLVWHNGQLYDCDVSQREEGEQNFHVVSEEVFEWWAKIATKNGKTGWTREIKKFGNVYSNE